MAEGTENTNILRIIGVPAGVLTPPEYKGQTLTFE
jgi:hypothetical protein